MERELNGGRIFHPSAVSPYRANYISSAGGPGLGSSRLAVTCNTITHGRHPNSSPLISQSGNAGSFSSRPVSVLDIWQQTLGSNHHGIPTEAVRYADPSGMPTEAVRCAAPGIPTEAVRCADPSGMPTEAVRCADLGIPTEAVRCADPFGDVQNYEDSDDRLLSNFLNGDWGYIAANGLSAGSPQLVGSGAISSNFPIQQLPTHQSFPSHSVHPQPTSPTPAAANAPAPKTRRRWTVELHDQFVDAVNQLGGFEKAKPKPILELMSVEGLTVNQVKSHLQKYRYHCGQGSSEGASEQRTISAEIPPPIVHTDSTSTEALEMQMEVQKRLHKQLKILRTLQLEIEKNVMYLRNFEKRQKLADASALSREVDSAGNSDGSEESNGHAETSVARAAEGDPEHVL